MAECLHGLDELWCGVCKHGPIKAKQPFRPMTSGSGDHITIRAGHVSTCRGCGNVVKPQEFIVAMERGSGETHERIWVHPECTEDVR